MKSLTIKAPIHLEGWGIHTGEKAQLHLFPCNQASGLRFFHTVEEAEAASRGQDHGIEPLTLSAKALGSEHNRATILQSKSISLSTPEHFLSACAGLGIYHLNCAVQGAEFPILDGSAAPFVQALNNAGIVPLDTEQETLTLSRAVRVERDAASIDIEPHSHFCAQYIFQHPDYPSLDQDAVFDSKHHDYATEIAAARTFGFRAEVQALLDAGLAKGASLENALLIEDDATYASEPRFANELARHKLLDLIGDFAILGKPLNAKITARATGHAMNAEAVKALSSI